MQQIGGRGAGAIAENLHADAQAEDREKNETGSGLDF